MNSDCVFHPKGYMIECTVSSTGSFSASASNLPLPSHGHLTNNIEAYVITSQTATSLSTFPITYSPSTFATLVLNSF